MNASWRSNMTIKQVVKEVTLFTVFLVSFCVLVTVAVDAYEFEQTGACDHCVVLPWIKPSLK